MRLRDAENISQAMHMNSFPKLTVSAATRFRPTPPALVEIMKTKASAWFSWSCMLPLLGCLLKLLIAANLSSARTEPSSRSYVYLRNSRKSYVSQAQMSPI